MVVRRPCTVRVFGGMVQPQEIVSHLEELEDFPTAGIRCVQKTIDGALLLTLESEDLANDLVRMDVMTIKGIPIVINHSDSRKEFIKVHYLPYEIGNKELVKVLKEFGHVFNTRYDSMITHPEIHNGVRTVTMILKRSIPSFITVEGYEIKIWYRNQEKTCRVCSRVGHFSKNCPEVKCYSCHKYGHVASECSEDVRCTYCLEVGHVSDRCQDRLDDERREREIEKQRYQRQQEEEMSKDSEADNERPEEESQKQAPQGDWNEKPEGTVEVLEEGTSGEAVKDDESQQLYSVEGLEKDLETGMEWTKVVNKRNKPNNDVEKKAKKKKDG